MLFPLNVRGRRLNGDAAFALQIHRVHRCTGTILSSHFVNRMNFSTIEQNSLGKCRLAGVDMCGNADIPHGVNVECHFSAYLL